MSEVDFVSAAQSILDGRSVLCLSDETLVASDSPAGQPVFVFVVDSRAPQFVALVRADENSSDVFPLYVGGVRSEDGAIRLDREPFAAMLDLVEFCELVHVFRDAGFPDDDPRLFPSGDPAILPFLAGVVRAATTGDGVANFIFGGGSFGPSSSEPN